MGALRCFWGALVLGISFAFSPLAHAGVVQIHDNQLWVDGQAQPQLYGAEVQYFRLRGGSGRNIPRSQVIALWNQALDRVVEAKMNAISFYIPWDFHEYAEGKFDFTGTADEDGDGNPDYPSRDLITFLRLVKEHGIKHILARPGPYINAEWGFLGFGAIPLWFHERYPNSHARNSRGQRTSLYSYNDPDFLRHARSWLAAVHEVLRPYIGPGQPIDFIQIDNETNFMWQSIYSHDFGSRAMEQYQDFLKTRYLTLATLNSQHHRSWASWSEIKAPTQPAQNIAEDQDWYRFQDFSMYQYLRKIRGIWTELGVTEPTVLFTLAESYNAAGNGVLPNYKWRNSPDTGMMTVNLYPKTYETNDHPLMNLPFKADLDVKAAGAANDYYLGQHEEWAMGPEIQGGWWKGTPVSLDSRRQTYLSTMGHGLKALFLYYFNEGDNWQHDWMKTAITPYYNQVKSEPAYRGIPDDSLPDSFWNELDALVADQFLVTNTRGVWRSGGTQPESLYFDAALGKDAQARAPYALVKELGEKIVAPYGSFLGKARELEDPVCVIKDTEAQAPSMIPGIDSLQVQSTLNGGLLGWLMHSGINARIHHWGLNPPADLLDQNKCRLLIYQDTGFATPELISTLTEAIGRGASVLTFLSDGVASAIRAQRPEGYCAPLPAAPMDMVGTRCQYRSGFLYQAKVPIYDVFNTDFYFLIYDAQLRRGVIDNILHDVGIVPHVKIAGGGDRTVTFARADTEGTRLWITAKTARQDGFSGRIQWTNANRALVYDVTNVLSGTTSQLTGASLADQGFPAALGASGSTAYFVEPARFARRPAVRASR
ncbi:MAG: beta-galactosidase [Bdellovibrionota bacterium]